MPKLLHLQEFHHPRLSLAAASNTILRSLGGELLLTLRQQTRNHHHLLRKGGSHRGFTCGVEAVRSISEKKLEVFPLFDEGNFVK